MSDKFKVHPDIDALTERLKFFHASYRGGLAYRLGKYLKKHSAEKDYSYKLRLAIASFRNFCAPVIDIYTSYLYREGVFREYGSIEKEVEEFLQDADLEQRPWEKVVREVSKSAGKFGMMGIIVDKPKSEAKTKAEEKSQEIRPYVVVYSPLQFVNYTFGRINGRQILTELILREDTGNEKIKRYMIWRMDSWELWEDDQRDGAEVSGKTMIDNGDNPLGRIPFVLVRNKDIMAKMQGVSDIEDIADINRRVYNFDGSADEINERCGFPQMERSVASLGEGKTVAGTGNVIPRAEDDEKGTVWIEPPHTSMPNILAWRKEAIEDIREMAKVGNMSTSGVQIESGAALEMRFEQLNAILSEKAENMEHTEIAVFTLFALWQELTWDGTIKYPRKFGIRDLSHDLDQAIKAVIAIPSKTFEAEQSKELAARLLKDADDKIITKINNELDNPPIEVDIGEGGSTE